MPLFGLAADFEAEKSEETGNSASIGYDSFWKWKLKKKDELELIIQVPVPYMWASQLAAHRRLQFLRTPTSPQPSPSQIHLTSLLVYGDLNDRAKLPMAPSYPFLQEFTVFLKLPTEIRLQIWNLASPLRQRVIEVFYDTEQRTWNACKITCGGLPTTAFVCQDSRIVALKTYTQAFDTFVDFEIDTIIIRDPCFNIRAPRQVFMETEYTKNVKRFACCLEIFAGLQKAEKVAPELCDGLAAILRGLEGLRHFTMIMSEEGMDIWDDLELYGYGHDLDNETARLASVLTVEAIIADYHEHPTQTTRAMRLVNASNNEDDVLQDYVDAIRLYVEDMFFQEEQKYPAWFRPSLGIKFIVDGLAPLNKLNEVYLEPGGRGDTGELEWWGDFNSDRSDFEDV